MILQSVGGVPFFFIRWVGVQKIRRETLLIGRARPQGARASRANAVKNAAEDGAEVFADQGLISVERAPPTCKGSPGTFTDRGFTSGTHSQ